MSVHTALARIFTRAANAAIVELTAQLSRPERQVWVDGLIAEPTDDQIGPDGRPL